MTLVVIISPTAEAHQQLLDYLKRNEAETWVTTFQTAMDYAPLPAKPKK
jgi:hypothetical protein